MEKVIDSNFVIVIIWECCICNFLSNRNVVAKVVCMIRAKARQAIDELADTCSCDVIALGIKLRQWAVCVVRRPKVVRGHTGNNVWSRKWSGGIGAGSASACGRGFTLLRRYPPEDLGFLTSGRTYLMGSI